MLFWITTENGVRPYTGIAFTIDWIPH